MGPPQEVAEEAGEPLPLEGAEEAEHHQEVAEAAESLRLEGAVEAEPRREAVVEAESLHREAAEAAALPRAAVVEAESLHRAAEEAAEPRREGAEEAERQLAREWEAESLLPGGAVVPPAQVRALSQRPAEAKTSHRNRADLPSHRRHDS